MAAFELLEASEGPVLVNYQEDVPQGGPNSPEEAMMGMVCPIELPQTARFDCSHR